MQIPPSLAYLLLAISVVLLLWIGALLALVVLLRQRLKAVTAERDRYAAQSKNIMGLIGQPVKVKHGGNGDLAGIVLWVLENEVGLQTETEQITVSLADIQIAAAAGGWRSAVE